jgi:Leucine-rich repeat (LRR) protein
MNEECSTLRKILGSLDGPRISQAKADLSKGISCCSLSGISCVNNFIRIINFDNSKINGTINESIMELDSLAEISMAGNRISGVLPSFTQLDTIKSIDFSNNVFTGLDLFETGTIPQDYGNLRQLRKLNLAGNKLSGELGPKTTIWTSLTDLDLSSNPEI